MDGEVHNNIVTEDRDLLRDSHLRKLGFKVLRFENKMVFENLSSVLDEIRSNFIS
ncbi:MAG: DUF559 domain-containing protein [Flavobacteriaceae bacterium]